MMTPTSGYMTVVCDEVIAYVMAIEGEAFMADYPDAHLAFRYSGTSTAINDLLTDKTTCIVSSREMDSSETAYAISRGKKVFSQKFALDGLAFLVHRDNPVVNLYKSQIESILAGRTLGWNDINIPFRQPILIVTDGDESGNYALLRQEFGHDWQLAPAAIELPPDSTAFIAYRIMDFIISNSNAIGYVSSSWLNNNPEYLKRAPNLKILKIARHDYDKPVDPIQGYIYRGDYPFRRMLFILHCEDKPGLAAGFTAFLTGNKGQKLCLDLNMVPAINPVKLKYE
ncbi:substrate-binding domain-containing protein [bacterium]|nr:substrate-binding domain-containing protein [bacterium]